MGIVAVTKMLCRGQTYIPSDIRRMLGLKGGDKIVWIEENGKVFIQKA